jgi:Ca2+-transporting ATPase
VLVVVIVSYATKTESVLNAVQLIWVNLIMDILGALALAATRPTDAIIDFEPGQGKLITPFMYRQIIGITLFQIGIMMVIMYGGKSVFEVDYEASTQTIEDDEEGKMKRTHFTLIWNTFIWLQFFNLINCRDVSAEKMHGCEKLHKNFLTWLILLIIGGVQVAGCFTFLGFLIFEARKTEGREFAVCVVAAASVIVANALLKLIPARWIAKMPALDESKALGGGSKLMSAYETQAAAKALPAKKKKED